MCRVNAVDKVESKQELAGRLNAKLPELLAKASGAKLIHISTGFVFEGNSGVPRTEKSPTNTISIYGKSMLLGEQNISRETNEYILLRTSWHQSRFGNNFVKIMLRLSQNREFLSFITDQIGTHALDLTIVHIMNSENPRLGIYHFSNEGVAR